MEIDGFEGIITALTLAKNLHDVGRNDIVEKNFFDDLCYDSYYDSIMSVTQNIFNGYNCAYDENNETELNTYDGDVISDYFVNAHEYGKTHKIPHDQNPFVIKAREEVRRWLSVSTCTDYKLLAYTKTRRAAKKSKLLVQIYNGCGCDAAENIAYGLIQVYKFFNEEVNGVPVPENAPIPGQLTFEDVMEMVTA